MVAAESSNVYVGSYSAISGLSVQSGGAPLFCGPIFVSSSTILNLTTTKEPDTVTSNSKECYYLPTFYYPSHSADSFSSERQATFYVDNSTMKVALVMDTAREPVSYWKCSYCWSGYEVK